MPSRSELVAEAYRRGLLPPQMRDAYEEAVRRGLAQDAYAKGRITARKGVGGAIAGGVATFNEAVPGLDEAQAGFNSTVNLGADLLTGKRHLDPKDPAGSLKKAQGEYWRAQRDYQAGLINAFTAEHPVLGSFSTGLGYAGQGAVALASGGTSAAPAATEATVAGVAPFVRRMAAKGIRNATVGATYAAGNAAAGRGTVAERANAAEEAIPAGAAVGVALPVAAKVVTEAPGAVAAATAPVRKAAVRTANKVASKTPVGPFLDAQAEVANRLRDAMRKDGLTPEQITQALQEWRRVGGPSPAFMDLVAKNGGGQNTMALFRGAGMGGGGRNVASQYANQVAVDLQDNAVARTRALTPDTRSVPDIEAGAASRIADAAQPPPVTPGAAGARVSAKLNAEYDAGRRAVNEAYDAVGASDARLSSPSLDDLPQRIRARLGENLITPEIMPSLNPATRGILGGIDNLAARAGRQVRAAAPDTAASLESGIPQGGTGQPPGFRLSDVERIRKAINARVTNAQGEDKIALDIAKREFDGWLGDALEQGAISGDAEGLQLLKTARGLHAQQRTTFGGEDLMQRLTERERHGAGTTTVVAPDDASNAILGRIGVSNRADMVRDLARLRDHLGAGSAEWRGVQQEAQARILGKDAGSENFGQAWDQFARQNPDLAGLLSTGADRGGLAAARDQIASAVADRNAVGVGSRIMSTPADDFAAQTASAARPDLVGVGAARGLQDAIERPPEGATGTLNRIASSTRSGRNLVNAFDPQAAADYQAAVGNMVDQVNNARFINPNTGSQTAGRISDEALVEAVPTSKSGVVQWIINKVRQHGTLTDQEREMLVRVATSRPEEVIPALPPPEVNAYVPLRQPVSRAALVGGITAGQTVGPRDR